MVTSYSRGQPRGGSEGGCRRNEIVEGEVINGDGRASCGTLQWTLATECRAESSLNVLFVQPVVVKDFEECEAFRVPSTNIENYLILLDCTIWP